MRRCAIACPIFVFAVAVAFRRVNGVQARIQSGQEQALYRLRVSRTDFRAAKAKSADLPAGFAQHTHFHKFVFSRLCSTPQIVGGKP